MAESDGAAAEYRCFVGSLSWNTDDRSHEAAFGPFGEVTDAKIINDREMGRSRGFGFVSFSTEQAMRDAIEGMDGKELDGRSIVVNEAQSRGFRGGGGRYGGGYGGQRHEGGYGDDGYGQRRDDGYGGGGRGYGQRRGGGYGGGGGGGGGYGRGGYSDGYWSNWSARLGQLARGQASPRSSS